MRAALGRERDQIAGTRIIMIVPDGPGLSRRRFMNASAAGLGATSIAGLAAACTGTGSKAAGADRGVPVGRDLADRVLEAFTTHRLVGLGEAHGLQNHHDALALLLTDARLPGVVDDILVEFGNALYQPTIDRFVSGQPVANADLRPVWRNTTQSPLETWDEPVYEQFYRTVRAINAPLPSGKRFRVLLGDPPIDWPNLTNFGELRAFAPQRDTHAASVIEQQVLAKNRRALICYGIDHLTHRGSLAGLLERRTGERVYLIADFVPAAGDPGGVARKLSRYPPNTVLPTAGTWLGALDAGLFSPEPQSGPHGPQSHGRCGIRLGSLIDAGLYLGQPENLTSSWWNPAIFLDAAYWRELQRRNALQGDVVNLESYRRRNLPALYPLTKLSPARECGKA